MIKTKNDIIIENSIGTLTITMVDGQLIFEINEKLSNSPRNLSIPVSPTDSTKLLDAIVMHLDIAKKYNLLYR